RPPGNKRGFTTEQPYGRMVVERPDRPFKEPRKDPIVSCSKVDVTPTRKPKGNSLSLHDPHIPRIHNNTYGGRTSRIRIENLKAVVGGPIVDNDDFVGRHALRQQRVEGSSDISPVVEIRQQHRYSRLPQRSQRASPSDDVVVRLYHVESVLRCLL